MADRDVTAAKSSHLPLLITIALVIAALYFAKEILLPLALALLLSFVLTPLVTRLERFGLGRTPSVILVTVITFAAIVAVGWLATNQVVELSGQLPKYKANLIAKIRNVRGATGGKLGEAQKALQDISKELTEGDKADENSQANLAANRWLPWLDSEPAEKPDSEDPLAVKVVALPLSPLSQIQNWLGPLVAPLSTGGMAIVLVIFILIKREDLRNRIIHLFGASRLYATTDAIDEAARRLSRFLRMQLLINTIYGVVVGVGLSLIGVPNALLWGVFGGLLRFLPYVGPWIAGLMPIVLSMAVSPGWMQPLLTIGLFITMEAIVNNVLEPWLYGSSTGVSSFGVILAAVFWTWLWGPIGLVLAMPLTVCLVVLGKHVPQLNFLTVLLSDVATLQRHEQLYQRLLAADDVEAGKLADEYLQSATLQQFYDEVLIPALHLAERDRHAGLLSDHQESVFMESTRELTEVLGDRLQSPTVANIEPSNVRALCVPACDEADEAVAIILAQQLESVGVAAELGSLNLLASELIARVEKDGVNAVAIVVLPPLGSRNARYLCKRLRMQFPELRVVVALLEGDDLKKTHRRLLDAGASEVAASLSDAISAVRRARTSIPPSKPHWQPSSHQPSSVGEP